VQLLYRIIYSPPINFILLKLNKIISPLTKFRLPPSGKIIVKLKSGKFGFLTNQTNTTSQLLFWKGPYKIEYTIIFEELIKKCNCFYDIGAHAGYYSLIAATVNKKIKVMAFEPAEGPFFYLNENVRLNHFNSRISCYQVALGESEGVAKFLEVVHHKYKYLKHNLVAVGNIGNPQPDREMKNAAIQVLTIDSFFNKNNAYQPDIIKMDTEGTENLILAGASTTILNNKPIIICETLFNKIEDELEKLMRSHGYDFYNYKNGFLHPVNTILRAEDNGIHDCFFVHPEKKELIEQFIQPQ
jgi:FkbM family methyltransferase